METDAQPSGFERWSTRLLVAQAASAGLFALIEGLARVVTLIPRESWLGGLALFASLLLGLGAAVAGLGAWLSTWRVRWLGVPAGAAGIAWFSLLVGMWCCSHWGS